MDKEKYVIANHRQRDSVQKQIDRLHKTLTGPPGSWLGAEQTRTEIMRLRQMIIDFDRRLATNNNPETGS